MTFCQCDDEMMALQKYDSEAGVEHNNVIENQKDQLCRGNELRVSCCCCSNINSINNDVIFKNRHLTKLASSSAFMVITVHLGYD